MYEKILTFDVVLCLQLVQRLANQILTDQTYDEVIDSQFYAIQHTDNAWVGRLYSMRTSYPATHVVRQVRARSRADSKYSPVSIALNPFNTALTTSAAVRSFFLIEIDNTNTLVFVITHHAVP